MRAVLVVLATLVVLFAGAVGATAWQFRSWLHEPVAAAGPVVVVIPPGTAFRQVAERLRWAGVIRHPILLQAWARYTGADRGVRSGEFLFDKALTPVEVLEKLRGSERFARRVTVPEGLTARQIRETLEQAGLGGRDVYECIMTSPELLAEYGLPATGIEGYLFPDTYEFEPGTTPDVVVRRMIDRFRQVSAELDDRRHAARMSEEEMVILASLIEKETGATAERRRVAGVFHNRMSQGMKLQSDPTVIYGRDGDPSRPISKSQLADPHRYNTYAHFGLPPGAIANPGRAALAAAVDPETTDALYFVSRNDGTHVFSPTLRDHNDAVRKHQR
jgi:UPF0755 protein